MDDPAWITVGKLAWREMTKWDGRGLLQPERRGLLEPGEVRSGVWHQHHCPMTWCVVFSATWTGQAWPKWVEHGPPPMRSPERRKTFFSLNIWGRGPQWVTGQNKYHMGWSLTTGESCTSPVIYCMSSPLSLPFLSTSKMPKICITLFYFFWLSTQLSRCFLQSFCVSDPSCLHPYPVTLSGCHKVRTYTP